MKKKWLIGLIAVAVIAAAIVVVKLAPIGISLSALGGFCVGFATGWISDELKNRVKKD